MKIRKNKIILFIMLLCLLFTGCADDSPTVGGILADGSGQFAEGKTDKDLPFVSSEDLLANLIADYSDSRSNPTGSQVSDDEADQIKKDSEDDTTLDETDPDGTTPDGTDGDDDDVVVETTPVITSRQEMKDLIHEMLDETKEMVTFELGGGFTLTTDLILDLYYELERDDPMDAISLNSFQYGGSPTSMLKFNYHIDVEQLKQMKEETRDLLEDAVDDIDVTGMSQYEIVCAVNNYLCDLITYPPNEPYAAETHTPYNAFKTGSAVCDGYAKAAKLMLNEYGVECDFIIGTCTNGGGHAWNMVKLDGEWYHMDVCWNDGASEWDAEGRTQYLLVTDEYMYQSRTWEAANYPVSAANPYVN